MNTKKKRKIKKKIYKGGEPSFKECFDTHVSNKLAGITGRIGEHFKKGADQLRGSFNDSNEKMQSSINNLQTKLSDENSINNPSIISSLQKDLSTLQNSKDKLEEDIKSINKTMDKEDNTIQRILNSKSPKKDTPKTLDKFVFSQEGLSRTRDLKTQGGKKKKKSKKKSKKSKKSNKSKKKSKKSKNSI